MRVFYFPSVCAREKQGNFSLHWTLSDKKIYICLWVCI